AEPAEAADGLAVGRIQGRVEGADEEGVGNPHPLQGLADDTTAEALDVDDDVGQLGHEAILTRPSSQRNRSRGNAATGVTSGRGRSEPRPAASRWAGRPSRWC